MPLRLAYRGAYDAEQVVDFLAARAVAGVEEVTGEPGSRTYRRTLRLPHGAGVAEVAERPGSGGWLECRLHLGDLRDLTTATQRVRRLFDLDADPYAVAERLGADPALAGSVARHPGLRAPGTPEPEEYALRAVIGDAGRSAAVAAAYGEPLAAPSGSLTRLFPRPADLADAALTEVGADVRPVLRAVATALADGLSLDPGADRDEAERLLLALPGVTPATAAAIRMRALGDPDVLLLPRAPPRPRTGAHGARTPPTTCGPHLRLPARWGEPPLAVGARLAARRG